MSSCSRGFIPNVCPDRKNIVIIIGKRKCCAGMTTGCRKYRGARGEQNPTHDRSAGGGKFEMLKTLLGAGRTGRFPNPVKAQRVPVASGRRAGVILPSPGPEKLPPGTESQKPPRYEGRCAGAFAGLRLTEGKNWRATQAAKANNTVFRTIAARNFFCIHNLNLFIQTGTNVFH